MPALPTPLRRWLSPGLPRVQLALQGGLRTDPGGPWLSRSAARSASQLAQINGISSADYPGRAAPTYASQSMLQQATGQRPRERASRRPGPSRGTARGGRGPVTHGLLDDPVNFALRTGPLGEGDERVPFTGPGRRGRSAVRLGQPLASLTSLSSIDVTALPIASQGARANTAMREVPSPNDGPVCARVGCGKPLVRRVLPSGKLEFGGLSATDLLFA
jgi:hypothetical protein